MRVLHVIDALGVGGGAEHSLASMLPPLRDAGIESKVVCLYPRNGGLGDKLVSQGFDVQVLDSSSWPGRVRELRRIIKADQPDLLHSTLVNACLVTRVATTRTRIPLLNSIVNTTYDPIRLSELHIPHWKLRTLQLVDGFTARHFVDEFHAISGAVATELTQVLGVPDDRITIIPRGRSRGELGTSTEGRRQRTRDRLGIDGTASVVLNVGRQDSQKAQDLLVRAFGAVVRALPGAVLLIAGREGAATERIHAEIERAGIESSVRLLGHRDDIADLLTACDVFAFPSHYEGLGCSLIEAMALGAPVVGSDAPAIAEVLGLGSYGEVVARGDDRSLSDALVRILGDPSLRDRLREQALSRFETYFALEVVVAETITLYEMVSGCGRGTRSS